MSLKETYETKLTTPEKIADEIKPGWTCVSDIGLGVPNAVCKALGEKTKTGRLSGVTMHMMLDTRPLPFFSEEFRGKLKGVSWFSGSGMRKAVNGGYADLMPTYYRDAPSLMTEYIDADAYLAVVSPMDKHGYFSTGCAASISSALINKAKRIYLQVNKNMPRALTAPMIHISQVTALCEVDEELTTLPPTVLDDVSITIGNLIAQEIPDGATIQLGIGAIPDAVGMALKSKCHLGIHTEMFTDSMVELLECGVVDNSMKPIHHGKTIASFALGSKRMYDYIDDNPGIDMLPVNYVNDPAVIAQHPNFMSINAALEVDFYGQVCAESIGTRHVSGTGGQVDYVRGAVMSKGGKSFLAFPSTAKDGAVSRIVPTLTPGAIVTTSKNDVDYIVTEYGVAKLRGKTLSQRTKALIAIAHPKFRDELTFAATKQNIMI
ncbi:MAG: acetyl-CoA hydrolase/transferase C-terminal domain-containing protein [Oscillospiraceae bacterium]|nr:acetyl-CoA hydrolase/transferase C-terminal domain-containing protein [Oscillospiraceae bacterium]